MNTIRMSATAARNNFFELLDKVSQGARVIVEKDYKDIAEIVPRKTKTDWVGLKKAMDAAAGVLKDYNPRDNPLRKPSATRYLGKWDRGLRTRKKS